MLLDVGTTARELGGLGESTVRKMIREGRLPSVRVGRRVMVSRDTLAEYIRRQQVRPLAAAEWPGGKAAGSDRVGA